MSFRLTESLAKLTHIPPKKVTNQFPHLQGCRVRLVRTPQTGQGCFIPFQTGFVKMVSEKILSKSSD